MRKLSLRFVFLLLMSTLCGVGLIVSSSKLHAQDGDDISFIRDAEIEHYLRELATPIYRSADIDPSSVSILIIQSSVINAFVAGGMNQFFYTGLLQQTETPEQLAGIIAHETGHIAGGHLIRGQEAMRNASAEAIFGALVAVAAGIASGRGDAAVVAAAGSQGLAERSLLSFSRSQESSADAAALSYLDRMGLSSKGMLEFMRKLGAQDIATTNRQAEYVRTHPLTQDRIETIAHHVESQKEQSSLDPKFKIMHERMKAKLSGFLQPEAALLRTTDKDPRLTVRYTRAIAFYRTNQLSRALALIDGLMKEEPQNPYFIELKAQMLFENGKIEESVDLYQKSVSLLPNSALLKTAYAHALLESKNTTRTDIAIQNLLDANRLEPRDPYTWRLLAAAWGKKAEATQDPTLSGLVNYALAEEAVARGIEPEAKQLADRALKVLPKGSPYWTRAQDIKLSIEKDK